MPCLRYTSTVFVPASCSRRIAIICSSLNRLRFIVRPPLGSDSTQIWRRFRGSGQIDQDEPLHPLRHRGGDLAGDHAAKRVADQSRRAKAETVQKPAVIDDQIPPLVELVN